MSVPVVEFHINGIIQNAVFCICFFFELRLSVVHSFSLLSSAFYDMIDHDLLIHHPVYLGCFKLLPIVNTAVMNACVHVFLWTYILSLMSRVAGP